MKTKFDDFPADLVISQFKKFLYSQQGGICPKKYDIDVKLDKKTRYQVEGDKGGETSGEYCVHSDGWAAGYAKNFRTEEYCEWSFDINELRGYSSYVKLYDQAKTKEFKEYAEQVKQQRETREAEEAREVLKQVMRSWNTAPDCNTCTHEYLRNKSVGHYGIKEYNKQLMIPLRDINNNLKSIQFIRASGEKRFYPDADAAGAFFEINLAKAANDKNAVILLCEGYATGATLHDITGCPVVCAMNCHNLVKIAPLLREKFKENKIIVCGDNDYKTKGNPGRTAAVNAVNLAGLDGFIIPEFKRKDKGTDWNDAYNLYGQEARDKLNDYIESIFLPEDEREAHIQAKKLIRLGVELDERIEIPPTENIAGVFPKGYISVLFAAPGAGKTLLMQKLASDLSLGEEILDGFYYEGKPRRVIIFEGEARSTILLKRARLTHWEVNSQLVRIYDRDLSLKQGVSYDLNTPEGLDNVRLTIAAEKPDIVFFDSLMAFNSSDESKSDLMNIVLKNLEQLAIEFNIAVVCTHHRRKVAIKDRGKSVTQDEAIGSTMLARHAAVMLAMEEMSGGVNDTLTDADNKVQLVKTVKTWDKKIIPFSFQIVENDAGNLDLLIDLNPFRNEHGNVKAAVWEFINNNFAPGVWFKSGDLRNCGATLRYAKTCIKQFVEEDKLKTRGQGKGTEYAVRSFYDVSDDNNANKNKNYDDVL